MILFTKRSETWKKLLGDDYIEKTNHSPRDDILNNTDELETIFSKDSFINDFFEDLKGDFPHEIDNLEESLIKYTSGNDFQFLKTEYSGK